MPVPTVPAAASPPPAPPSSTVRRTALPSKVGSTSWRVTSAARIRVNGAREDERVETQARVSWALERQPSGGARASGQVDGFTIRSSLDSGRVGPPPPAALLLLDGVIDSTTLRVVTRPPQANECDRSESSAASLARELLVRIPDGLAVGDSWRDSTVSLICRVGVPIAVHTIVQSRLERLTDDILVVRREVQSRLEGKGGSPFRSLELTGTGSGDQRLEISAQRGTVERLEGTSTLTLQVSERSPSTPVRTQQVVQRVELKAERVAR